MSDVNPGDVCQVNLIGDIDSSDEIIQSYQFQLDSGDTGKTADQAFEDWYEILLALWAIIDNLFTIRTMFRSIRAKNVTTSQLLGELGFATPFVGLGVGSQAAYQATMPIAFTTVHPRIILKKMIGPLATNAFGDEGLIVQASMIVGATYASMLLAPLVATLGTWHYGHQSPIALQFVDPIAAAVSKRPGALGRRRAGRGS